MTNTMSKLEEVEAVLVDLGFAPASVTARRNLCLPEGAWMHATKLVAVVTLDDEGCWEAVLFEDRESRIKTASGRQRYFVETGRVRLTNLSSRQFETVLGSLL